MLITNTIIATITAYCSCSHCCGSHSKKGLTADGHKPIQGITIAASKQIPFGTKIYIASNELHSWYTVQDRLAPRYDSRFDIYFKSHKAAQQFGIRTNQQITIITYEQK